MIVIGIDIGLTGAVARVGGGLPPAVVDMPVVADGERRMASKTKTETVQPMRVDGRGLLQVLRDLCPVDQPAAIVLFENVRPRPEGNGGRHGNTMHSQGSLMRSRGVVEATVDIARFSPDPVQPQTWKKFYGINGADKDDSLEKARLFFPELAAALRLKKHHNRAEALLIAHYGLRTLA